LLLNCHTYYSFGYGTYAPKDLLDHAQQHGHQAYAITDINNTSGVLSSLQYAAKKNMHVIPGVDFRNGVSQCYIALAQNNTGYQEINQHLSNHLHHNTPFNSRAHEFNHAFVIYPFATYKGWPLKYNEFIGIAIHELNQLQFSSIKNQTNKLVALHQISFASPKHFNAHRLLRAIHTNNLLSKLPKTEQAYGHEQMLTDHEIVNNYAAFPYIIANTNAILNSCKVDIEFNKLANKNLKHYTTSIANDVALLKTEAYKGVSYRYTNPSKAVFDRITRELDVIEKLNFSSYFLINYDIIKYAKHKGYFHVGRGSGANSIIAYLLGITDVDPIELDLYFERFINMQRSNAPDFDIDFSWTDRDDITQYIFKRFGHERTALLGAYNTYQNDAITRELGKVFVLPPTEIEKLQQINTQHPTDKISQLVINYSQFIKGYPSHLSVHASGILISEAPIASYTATILPPKNFPTTQFSMIEAEDIGLFKFDILSQRGLGKIKDAVELIKQNKNVSIDIHQVQQFIKDEKVKDLLRTGDTIGCFYIESPAMRGLLIKLKADDYLRLVAASSIIRPGVSKSGMMREYILRFRDKTLRDKARNELPELYDILHETYGVMVYQEDVIKVAHLFAGLNFDQADTLRRGMNWKYKNNDDFKKVKAIFHNNCIQKGIHKNTVEKIWNQIESFANFAFAKGHSASYAVESYQALFLKAHYPLEYMVATLNNGGGFYRKEIYIHEAKLKGANIQLPCINKSLKKTTIEGCCIYIGLGLINELNEQLLNNIIQERNINGIFTSLENFKERIVVKIEQLSLLIRAGCFRFTQKGKNELLWQSHILNTLVTKNYSANHTLFKQQNKPLYLPKLIDSIIDDSFDQLNTIGFSLNSPFSFLRNNLPTAFTAKDLKSYLNKKVSIAGYLVTQKPIRTLKGQRMFFGTFLDIEGQWIDTIHFAESAGKYPVKGPGCYVINGVVIDDYDFVCIDVKSMYHLPVIDREIQRIDTIATNEFNH
jgi:DNA polymerase-3 subunit alpha